MHLNISLQLVGLFWEVGEENILGRAQWRKMTWGRRWFITGFCSPTHPAVSQQAHAPAASAIAALTVSASVLRLRLTPRGSKSSLLQVVSIKNVVRLV